MVFDVVQYDQYYDIPLRGILQIGSTMYAFKATVLYDEPAEIADRPGIYSRLQAIESDEELRAVMEETAAIFWPWRAAFDKHEVDESSHPLHVNPTYQRLAIQTDELFKRLGPPVIDVKGLMNCASGQWVFEYLESGQLDV